MIIEKALDYCRTTLKNVSRSFSLTIPLLEKNIIIPVMIGYLEARILDSFEDERRSTDNVPLKERMKNLNMVMEILDNPSDINNSSKIEELKNAARLHVSNPHYLDLVLNMENIMHVHRNMDEDARNSITKWFGEMNAGMQKYLQKNVETFQDLDEYCYYVAGTVGGFLTDMVISKSENLTKTQENALRENQKDFGLFLQKVNVIRDFREDLLVNDKVFWPLSLFNERSINPSQTLDRSFRKDSMEILDLMIRDANRHVGSVVNYINSVPSDFNGFKSSSSINFLLGLETVKKLVENDNVFYGESPVKVDRKVRERIMKDPLKMVESVSFN